MGLHHPRWTPTAYAMAREALAGHAYIRYDQMQPLDLPKSLYSFFSSSSRRS